MTRVPGTYEPGVRTIVGVPGTVSLGFREPPIREIPVGAAARALDAAVGVSRSRRAYQMGDCRIIVSRDAARPGRESFWHLSISCVHRHPTWDEIKVARYRLLPNDLAFAMFLPPPEEYVNVPAQDHVFHLWECPDPRSES